jgi:predicted negative regulator of RcsB-dependent stress response
VVLTARGKLDEAMVVLQEGAAVAERAIMRAHCLTRVYATLALNRLAAGDVQAADHALALGLAMSERHGNCATCDALLLPAAVSVRAIQNDIEGATAFSNRLDAAAKEYSSRTWRAMSLQSRGELFVVKGDIQEALTCYRDAHQAFLEAGNQYEAARCLQAISKLETEIIEK